MSPTGPTSSRAAFLAAVYAFGAPGGCLLILLSWWLLTLVAGSGTAAEWWEYALVGAIGPNLRRTERGLQLDASRGANTKQLAVVRRVASLWAGTNFFVDASVTESALRRLDAPARTFFAEQATYALNTLVFGLSGDLLRARIAKDRAGDADGPLYSAYLDAPKRDGWGGVNRGFYSSEKVDSLIEKALATVDYDERDKIMQEVWKTAWDDAALFTTHSEDAIYANSPKVKYEPRVDQHVFAWDLSLAD